MTGPDSVKPPVDAEDRADGHVEIDVRGAVERIEDEEVLAHRVLVGDGQEIDVLLGGQPGQAAGVVGQADDGQVGEAVELHDRLALDVDVRRAAQDLGQAGPGRLAGDDLPGQGQVVEDVGQGARGLGVDGLLVEDVPLDGDDGGRIRIIGHDASWRIRGDLKVTRLGASFKPGAGLAFRERGRI